MVYKIGLEKYGFSWRGWLKQKLKHKREWTVIYEYIGLSKQDKSPEEE